MRGSKYAVVMLGIAVCFAVALILNVQAAYAEVDRHDLAQAIREEVRKLEKENPALARELVNEYREYARTKPVYEREEAIAVKIDQRDINKAKATVEKPNIAAVHIDKIDKLAIRDDMKQLKEARAVEVSDIVEKPAPEVEIPDLDPVDPKGEIEVPGEVGGEIEIPKETKEVGEEETDGLGGAVSLIPAGKK